MATTQYTRPSWYTDEDDSAWSKVQAAFRRDWKQTKHDFGGNEPNLNQQVGDTISQAAGSKPIPPGNAKTPHSNDGKLDAYNDDDEPAYRYGYAASRHFNSEWDDKTEAALRKDFGDSTEWERRQAAIRRGWAYGKNKDCGPCDK
ncbi:hypothetical protein [Schlesneria paludicola]|uniref:hypothetical protein n=1 Tax=Schlesneria paludicola TaxID=360056 RepID=UPI0007C5896F|nr:hypothetical protein [Schlesneria paludicola]